MRRCFRITVADQHLISAKGCMRLSGSLRSFIPVKMLGGGPMLLGPEVQEYMLEHVGYESYMRNHFDRVYYPGDALPSIEAVLMAAKIPPEQRKWMRHSVPSSTGKIERYIRVWDQVAGMAIMLRFGIHMREMGD